MTRVCATLLALLVVAASAGAQTPEVDYHQHLFSPAAAALVTGEADSPGISARDVIRLLDDAGIRRALVLSVAYTWGRRAARPSRTSTNR